MAIAFIDLQAQRRRLSTRIDQAVARVLEHGGFILGPEVAELERRLSAYCGARHSVTCANGTDAITLALMAEGIGIGDCVIVPSFTFVATAEAPAQLGATPYFVDVEPDTFNIDPAGVETAIDQARERGLCPRAVIAVDLFGQPADYGALRDVCARHELILIADAAQSFGASFRNARVGTLADYTTTSFYPAKPLGCYGDGGAVFTEDAERAEKLFSLRVHGQGGDRYDNVRIGVNSRLDTIQAAILIEKLSIFDEELEARDRIAARYASGLEGAAQVPATREGMRSVWAQYTIVVEGDRDGLRERLGARGVPTQVYYPIPLHKQGGYAGSPALPGGLPVSERLSRAVLSLPFHPYLEAADQDRVIEILREELVAG